MIVAFDINNKLHQEIFRGFKNALVAPTDEKDDILAQYTDYIDNLDIILRDVAVEDLNCDPEIEDMQGYWAVAIANDSPTQFQIICAFEFVNYATDAIEYEFLKCEGSILIEDDAYVIFNIDSTSIDYSNEEDFKKMSKGKV